MEHQSKDQVPKVDKENKKKPPKKKFSPDVFPLPEFTSHRIQVWDEVKKQQEAENEKKPIKITLADGSVKDGVAWVTSPVTLAKEMDKELLATSVVAKVNDELYDLKRPLEKDCKLEYIKFDSEEGKKVFWHSSAHILGQALERKFKAKLCIGPPVEDGFYYDVALEGDKTVNADDYEDIQDLVNYIISEKQPFERLFISKEKALEMFKYSKYKTEIISTKVPDGQNCSIYRCGPLIDLCKGPHVLNTGVIKALAITKNSSTNWKGDVKNDPLQRVYGISFPQKELLEEWLHFRAEAAKIDHRNIGRDQELFFFNQFSPGSAFFLPHGTKIYNKLLDFLRKEYRARGFTEVMSPNIFNSQLWKQSGHWDKYAENMFRLNIDEQEFGLKPMNCPGHCMIFDYQARSYRELPIRLADFGALHRNESAGALTGLTRVRRFQQDDAHIFCTPEQIRDEINNAFQFLSSVYGVFGFEFKLALSTRPAVSLGDDAVWETAEKALTEALNNSGHPWKLNPGDGAFYGPKIDVHISDALKRQFQCATIQLDFNLPERFKLSYRKADDSNGRPVIIHRAIFGSIERFLAILCEHCGGKWPFWISPRQAIVCTVSNKFNDYGKQIQQRLWAEGFDIDMDESDNTLKKKIHDAQVAQYNFILVIGEKEMETKTINIRTRDNVVHGTKSVDDLILDFQQLLKDHK